MATDGKNTRNKAKKRRFYKKKRFWFGLTVMGLAAGAVGLFFAEQYTRPYRERAETYDLARINDLEIPSLILDRHGKEIGRVFVQNRSVMSISGVPQIFIDALRAGEDQRFNTHDGVDYIGIVRAVWLNWRAGETTQGASTVTQQLARNAYNLEAERIERKESGIERKLVEAFLARRIEKRYSKPEILEFYLNRIYFGSGFYGIRSASLGYFGKEPKDLTALESAAIVGCIKSPSNLSPLVDEARNQRSRNLVLGRMVDLGAVTSSDVAKLRVTPLKLNPKPLQRGTNHLYERVADEIRRELGEDALAAGGFRIHTSIDGDVQRSMEVSLERSLERAEQRTGYANQKRSQYRKSSDKAPEYLQGAAFMADHQTGEVIAHIGGRSYEDAPYDVIELGRRPLGTAFYPFLYAAALQQGLTAATIVEDDWLNNRLVMVGGREGVLGEWGMEVTKPPRPEGRITMRRAFEWSKTAASVRLANMAGLDHIRKTAEGFGLPMKDAELLPRLAVGWEEASLKESVRAISSFARGGYTAPQQFTYVDRIENAAGRSVYNRQIRPAVRREPVDDSTAYIVHTMMRGAMEKGNIAGLTDRLVERPFTGAGKTGTTHDFSDNWFLGYNGRVACGVWVGFLQPGKSIYPGAFSKETALPVWEDGMNAAAAHFGGKVISQPETVVQEEICRVSGQRATPYCYDTYTDPSTGATLTGPAKVVEYFRKGTENLPFCPVHSGAAPGQTDGIGSIGKLPPMIDTTPVRAKSALLVGEDPYYTEQLMADREVAQPYRNRTNVLDSYDLGDSEKAERVAWPERLEIHVE